MMRTAEVEKESQRMKEGSMYVISISSVDDDTTVEKVKADKKNDTATNVKDAQKMKLLH